MGSSPNSGLWPAAVVMIVVASFLLYRYAAPRTWREWRGAGLVQAFIIALYAEMYGFPLTLYVLTAHLGIDIPWRHDSGHLWATLLEYGIAGQVVEMLLGYLLVFTGIGLLVEGWRELYRAEREGQLATDGVYGLVRHPQYTGIILAIVGQLIHWPTLLTLLLFPVIVWAYVRLAKKEEAKMVARFGEAYLSYRRAVPMLIPEVDDWKRLATPEGSLSRARLVPRAEGAAVPASQADRTPPNAESRFESEQLGA